MITAGDLLKQFETSGKAAAAKLLAQSEALGKSALTTTNLTVRAGKDLVAGAIDIDGALFVAKNAFNQLKQLAMAEGNLVANSFIEWLEGLAQMLLKLLPGLPI